MSQAIAQYERLLLNYMEQARIAASSVPISLLTSRKVPGLQPESPRIGNAEGVPLTETYP